MRHEALDPRGVPQIANSSGETSPKQVSVVRPKEDKDATCWPVARHQHDLREAITYTDPCWGSRLDTRHRPTFRRALTSRTRRLETVERKEQQPGVIMWDVTKHNS